MTLLHINQALCTNCGLCVSVCPRGLILHDQHWPIIAEPSLCISCGHCVAVCPASALDNSRTPLADQIPLSSSPSMNNEHVFLYLRSRRSIRSYQATPVPRSKLLELMDIARFAPSGGNSQSRSYLIIDRPEILRRITESTISWMEEPAQKNSPAAKIYAQYAAMYRNTGSDSILRNAPVLVLGTAAKTFARGRENSLFSLAYVELYAPSIGLGTCWAGLLESAAFSGYAPVLDLLGIPESKQLTGALMVGYPKIAFHRLPDRNPLDITFQEP